MKRVVDINRHTWNAAFKLAAVISIVAGFTAIMLSAASDIPQAAIVLPVIVVAFTASWIQTSRAHREQLPVRLDTTHRR